MLSPEGFLEAARSRLGLSHDDLWCRYFGLGGMSSAMEIEAYLYGALRASDRDHDLLAVALNERCSELGGDHPLPYSDDEPTPGA